jgi:aryl-alcohol dehydrogenase-like predicted oxidoreductase
MQYTHLGRSGLKVSRLCLGTMNFGPQTEESAAHAIMDSALGAGINFFDTANVYGGADHRGWTEEIIGRWFAKGGERRERTVLATKLYGTMTDRPNESKLSALNIRRALDASLKRLQTDYIDIYQFHHVDRNTPWDEIWQAIDVAVQQGKILYSGSSNFAGWHIAQAQEAAAAPQLHRTGKRAVHLQPADPERGAGGPTGRPAVRAGDHPVVSAARRAPWRGAQKRARRRPAP